MNKNKFIELLNFQIENNRIKPLSEEEITFNNWYKEAQREINKSNE